MSSNASYIVVITKRVKKTIRKTITIPDTTSRLHKILCIRVATKRRGQSLLVIVGWVVCDCCMGNCEVLKIY
jgi:hypothetical protein